jgi:peptide/nickel transport system permease protein
MNNQTGNIPGQERSKRPGAMRRLTRQLIKSKTGTIGLLIVILVFLTAILAEILAPNDPAHTEVSKRLTPPMWMEGGSPQYPLGTDNLGRDELSRIIHGSKISLIVGIGSVVLAGLIGISFGLIAGFYGGWIDLVIMRIVDAFLAIPGILFMLVILSVLGPNTLTLVLVLGLTNWTQYARIVRGEVLSVKERDFVRAARAIGTKDFGIIMKHIFPNIISSLIVISTLSVATTIILEASLSFLGLGIQPPTVSWGGMLSDGRQYLATSWWVATFPGIAITITVLGIIFLGDFIRDILDPRMKARGSK